MYFKLRRRQIILRTFLFLIVFSSHFNIYSQLKNDTSKKVGYLIVPIIFTTPETGISFGLTNSLYFKTTSPKDSLIRMSSIQTVGFFTTRKQNVQAVDAAIYFPKERFI